MSAYDDLAAHWEAVAERMDAGLAVDVVREQARDFLAILRIVTPKRTGKLAGSETIDSAGGGGTFASAKVSPHIIYAEFRENGGTITAHGGLGRKGMRPHTLHWGGGGFPLSVTQAGAHYVEKAQAAAKGQMDGIAQSVLDEFLG